MFQEKKILAVGIDNLLLKFLLEQKKCYWLVAKQFDFLLQNMTPKILNNTSKKRCLMEQIQTKACIIFCHSTQSYGTPRIKTFILLVCADHYVSAVVLVSSHFL